MKTVRIKPVQRGIRTYYRSQILVSIFGIKVWRDFSAYKFDGTIMIDHLGILHSAQDINNTEENIEALKYIYGDENVKIVEYGKS